MRDEEYIIELCNKVLDQDGKTQHRFDFLRGDKAERKVENGERVIKNVIKEKGVPLPVDAYYEKFNLVVEYHERQHYEPVKFFDKPEVVTLSGVSRSEQRKIYDQRRREVLSKRGIDLLEMYCTDFKIKGNGKLKQDKENDESILRSKLSDYLNK